jgi:hypothetical protein
LKPSFRKLPGSWSPKGLAFEWEPARSPSGRTAEGGRRALSIERLRGLEYRNLQDLDPASAQICRYYGEQLSCLSP